MLLDKERRRGAFWVEPRHFSPTKKGSLRFGEKMLVKSDCVANDHFYPSSLNHLCLTQKNLPRFLSSLNNNFISLLFSIENNLKKKIFDWSIIGWKWKRLFINLIRERVFFFFLGNASKINWHASKKCESESMRGK